MSALPPGEPVWTPDEVSAIVTGKVDQVSEDSDRPVAVLWVPDPEQRHGWREYYVKKAMPKPCDRMGYRKR